MKKIKYLFFVLAAVLLGSCAKQITRGSQYSLMYQEKPTSIVIMPPINETNSVEAKDYFYTTMYMPLCEKGYYVFSPYLVMDLFQSESAYDSERFLDADLGTFRKVLGADAACFTKIKSWEKNMVLGYIKVDVEYILRSTVSGQILYHREGVIKLNTQVHSSSPLLAIAATAIRTAATDKINAGRVCNSYVLQDFPSGKYKSDYIADSVQYAGKPLIKATVDASK